jgi:Flp pilus assembly protein TadD
MRGVTLGLLALLAACSPRGSTGVGDGPAGLSVADAAMRGGSPEVALQIVDTVLAKNPDNEAALLTQGEALTELRRVDEASVSFTKALAQNPASVGAHIGLGRIRLATDPAGAEALFLEALQREPRNGVALNDLGIARDLQGNHTGAQEAYRQALGVVPDMTAAQVNLALSLAMSGQSKDAIQLLRPLATGSGASQQVRHDLAAVLTMGGDKPEAARILSQDLSANDVQQALNAFAAGGGATTASLLTPAPVAADARPAPPPVAADAKPAVEPVRATSGSAGHSGTMEVQLAAVPSEEAAQSEWRRLQEQVPQLLGDHHPIVTKIERDGRVFWRLRTDGFADASEAAAFCARLRAAGTACVATQ